MMIDQLVPRAIVAKEMELQQGLYVAGKKEKKPGLIGLLKSASGYFIRVRGLRQSSCSVTRFNRPNNS